jgi:hypothetical protein
MGKLSVDRRTGIDYPKYMNIPHYNFDSGKKLRFISNMQYLELLNLFHLGKVALAGQDDSRYNRMVWASKEFNKIHPEISATAAYKDLEVGLD